MRERMGSGGPRGLQILLSVADRGRGGFDSHTFPPLVIRLVAALGLALGAMSALAPGARAQASVQVNLPAAAAHDTSVAATRPDSTSVRAAAPTRPERPPGEVPRPWHATPFAIMARSALVPGWGQAANHRWLKAGIALGVEGWAGSRFLKAWKDVKDANQRTSDALAAGDANAAALAQADYDAAFQRRANAGWLFGVAAVLSMMDAYVDAHFLQFDADFGPDPALPDDGKDTSFLRTAAPTLRLAVRVSIP
jgi:hypothetical protein